jgi:hypothetical protein
VCLYLIDEAFELLVDLLHILDPSKLHVAEKAVAILYKLLSTGAVFLQLADDVLTIFFQHID